MEEIILFEIESIKEAIIKLDKLKIDLEDAKKILKEITENYPQNTLKINKGNSIVKSNWIVNLEKIKRRIKCLFMKK